MFLFYGAFLQGEGGGAGWYKSGPGLDQVFFHEECTPLENINEIVLKTFVSLTA